MILLFLTETPSDQDTDINEPLLESLLSVSETERSRQFLICEEFLRQYKLLPPSRTLTAKRTAKKYLTKCAQAGSGSGSKKPSSALKEHKDSSKKQTDVLTIPERATEAVSEKQAVIPEIPEKTTGDQPPSNTEEELVQREGKQLAVGETTLNVEQNIGDVLEDPTMASTQDRDSVGTFGELPDLESARYLSKDDTPVSGFTVPNVQSDPNIPEIPGPVPDTRINLGSESNTGLLGMFLFLLLGLSLLSELHF